ncbi:MAG TPA: hypothetical protein VIS29_16170 [Streptomyces sp.]|jgi:hypothetical protein
MSARTSSTPPGTRPHRRQSETGPEQTVIRTEPDGSRVRLDLRQVGWHGQTGAFYSLDEHPTTSPSLRSPRA